MLNTAKHVLEGEVGKPLKLAVPVGGEILRGGIDFGTQLITAWVLFDVEKSDKTEDRFVVVVTTGMSVPDGATHRGMWWVGADTFHLFELEGDPNG